MSLLPVALGSMKRERGQRLMRLKRLFQAVVFGLLLASLIGCTEAPDDPFFRLDYAQQMTAIRDSYTPGEAIDLYLQAMTYYRPHPSWLAMNLAMRGEELLPELRRRLADQAGLSSVDAHNLIELLYLMESGRHYEVSADPSLMKLIDDCAARIQEPGVRGQAERFKDRILALGEQGYFGRSGTGSRE